MNSMEKLKQLEHLLVDCGKVAIALSGGVDSSFLIKAAHDVLGAPEVLAITIRASVNPQDEIEDAVAVAKKYNVEHVIVDADVFEIEGFKQNPEDRCYICKKAIFTNVIREAQSRGVSVVIDGTNADDEGDYRPGMKALKELGVRSPLKECGFTKAEIRDFADKMHVPTSQKPSLACLASRIPYHEEITEEKLRMVEKAEKYLRSLGFTQYRVRCHGNLARIELLPEEMNKIFDRKQMEAVNRELKEFGFKYITLDLLGYRTGSLNEVLSDSIKTQV